jgi:uncharacterized protein DUF1566/Sel1 repeat-containing protein
MVACVSCGAQNSDSSNLCVQCGTRLSIQVPNLDQHGAQTYRDRIHRLVVGSQADEDLSEDFRRLREKFNVSLEDHNRIYQSVVAAPKSSGDLKEFHIEFDENLSDCTTGSDTYLQFRCSNQSESDKLHLSFEWTDPDDADTLPFHVESRGFIKPRESVILGQSYVFSRPGTKEIDSLYLTVENILGDCARYISEPFHFNIGRDQKAVKAADDPKVPRWRLLKFQLGTENPLQLTPEEQYLLGKSYYDNYKEPRDNVKAARCFRKAAEQGYAEAQYWLGKCYDDEIGFRYDKDKKVKWYWKAAESGHPEAQYMMGECYRRGSGLNEDHNKAFQWYLKAAEQGHIKAQVKVGECYSEGDGVTRDLEKAGEWLHKAVLPREKVISNPSSSSFQPTQVPDMTYYKLLECQNQAAAAQELTPKQLEEKKQKTERNNNNCEKCAEPIVSGAAFCVNCGTPIGPTCGAISPAPQVSSIMAVQPKSGIVLAGTGFIIAVVLSCILLGLAEGRHSEKLEDIGMFVGFGAGAAYIITNLRRWKKKNEIVKVAAVSWMIAWFLTAICLVAAVKGFSTNESSSSVSGSSSPSSGDLQGSKGSTEIPPVAATEQTDLQAPPRPSASQQATTPQRPSSQQLAPTVVQSAAVWTDPVTGLMWTRESNSSDVDWNQAKEYCANLTIGGYSDWRLPVIDELVGIHDATKQTDNLCYIKGDIISHDSCMLWSESAGSVGTALMLSLSFPGHLGQTISPNDRGNDTGLYATPIGDGRYNRALCVRRSEN